MLLTNLARQEQWRLAEPVPLVNLALRLGQHQLHSLDAARLGGPVQRRVAVESCRRNVCPSVQHLFEDFFIPVVVCLVWCLFSLGSRKVRSGWKW